MNLTFRIFRGLLSKPSTTSAAKTGILGFRFFAWRKSNATGRGVRTACISSVLCGLMAVFGNRVVAEDSTPAKAPAEKSFATVFAPFLENHCHQCHGEQEQSGERRFDRLSGSITDDRSLVDWQDILDQLNLGEMPPQDAKQPSVEQRLEVIDWLTREIQNYHESRAPSRQEVVLRRLNSREYRNTIRDLLHLNMLMFNPAEKFPRDQQTEHLDNVGDALVTSGHLLAGYLEAADTVVNKAMFPLEKPEVQTWRFEDGFNQQPEIDQVHRKTNFYTYLTLYDVIGADKHEGAYAPIHAFAEGVPYDGWYEMEFKAAAVNREHPYEDEFLGTDRREPLRLGIVAGNVLVGPLHKPQPVEPLLAELDLADEMSTYTVRIWLDRGYTPRFTFRNGLMDARNLWSRVQKKYPDLFEKVDNGIVAQRYNAIANGKLPQIHVDDVEIRGPFYDEWPRASQRELLGEDFQQAVETGQLSDDQMRRHLARFMQDAYRRPVQSEEIERVLSVIHVRQQTGRSPLEAYSDGIKTVLCSPNFLFWDEGDSDQLSPWAMAARLSSFLWSSMPDAELTQHAAIGDLTDASVLSEQIERMLDDPKSIALVDGFLDSWLTLRELGSTPPDRSDFVEFYHYDLGTAMREETRLFTAYLLEQNLNINNFLDSDFTFVNKRLAQHYGLAVPEEIQCDAGKFVRIPLDNRRRGGLLGQASVLTVTANGIDTSPVVRGVWLLENILGTPPSPPPPDVEPLDPDVRGAQSIRDQLEKHRSLPSCYDCHRKIDPLGFALENFDPVGKWRDEYDRGVKIESAGELPNGKTFGDIMGLKEILVGQQDLFAKSLTEKLLAYAIGRQLEPTDRPEVDRIVSALHTQGNGFRDLIREVVLSKPFQTK